MLIVLSPAKKLDFDSENKVKNFSEPIFINEATQLIGKLRTLSRKRIGELMKISPNLSDLNYNRYKSWSPSFTSENARQAVLAFNGEVYWGLEAKTFSKNDFKFAQRHIRILSGLHGVLRPLDLIHPYRLEMGSKLSVKRTKNLYEFWGDKIIDQINLSLDGSKERLLVNLASKEYFKSINLKKLDAEILDIQFKDKKGDEYKALMAYAKRARGMMARYIVQNRIKSKEKIRLFNVAGYTFNDRLSIEQKWVFTRD